MPLSPDSHDKPTVKDALTQTADQIRSDSPQIDAHIAEELGTVENDPSVSKAKISIAANLDSAAATMEHENDHPTLKYVSRDPVVGVVQSAINLHTQKSLIDFAIPAALRKYGPGDPTWLECVLGKLVDQYIHTGSTPFHHHTNLSDFVIPIPSKCRVALLADWGADTKQARLLAKEVEAANPDYVIHLGDIYYSGDEHECHAFLENWPLKDPTTGLSIPRRSFALNGNHEMFIGGRGYFGVVLKAFKQDASYFCLTNDDWQIFGLDTAFVDHRLPEFPEGNGAGYQWPWLVDKINTNTHKGNIFLTHHQPISAHNPEYSQGANLRADINKLLSQTREDAIFGWFFGHEHRCAIYDDQVFRSYKARLIGNGCIPHSPQEETGPDEGCIPFADINRASSPLDKALAICTAALLDFDGPFLTVSYINEDGSPFFKAETWERPA